MLLLLILLMINILKPICSSPLNGWSGHNSARVPMNPQATVLRSHSPSYFPNNCDMVCSKSPGLQPTAEQPPIPSTAEFPVATAVSTIPWWISFTAIYWMAFNYQLWVFGQLSLESSEQNYGVMKIYKSCIHFLRKEPRSRKVDFPHSSQLVGGRPSVPILFKLKAQVFNKNAWLEIKALYRTQI